MVPIALVPILTLLASRRPMLSTGAFLVGIFASYLAIGVAIMFGLQGVFEAGRDYFQKWWADPEAPEYVVQIIVGAVLALVGWWFSAPPKEKSEKNVAPDVSPVGAFAFAVGINLVGAPGAIPYFAAIDKVLHADLSPALSVFALAIYNLTFTAPLIVIVIVKSLLGEKAEPLLNRFNDFMTNWGRRIVMVLIFALGVLLVVDGVMWFGGSPLLPPDAFN